MNIIAWVYVHVYLGLKLWRWDQVVAVGSDPQPEVSKDPEAFPEMRRAWLPVSWREAVFAEMNRYGGNAHE